MLAAAAAALTAVLLGAAVIAATFEGRALREAQRRPVIAASAEQAAAYWGERPDSAGRWQHSVVYLDGAGSGAPPPPGLPEWPASGEAYLSPALAAAEPGITGRYGRHAGAIGPEGLLSPAERLAYVGLPEDAAVPEDWMYPITGFGPPGSFPFGEGITFTPAAPRLMAAAYLVFVVLPAAALFVVAARWAAAGRDRRDALLTALGAGTRHRFLVGLSSCLPPVLAGAAAAALAAVPLLLADTGVPGIDYTLRAADVRRGGWLLLGAVAVSVAACAAGCAALHARWARRGAVRPRSVQGPVATWKIGLFAVGTGVASAAALFPPGSGLAVPVYAVGLVAALVAAPSAMAAAIAWAGAAAARRGLRAGRPAWIVAGRWCEHRPGVVARLVAPVVIGVVTVVNVHYFLASETLTSLEARLANERVGDSALQLRAYGLDAGRIAEAGGVLPGRARLVAVDTEGGGPPVLRAPCPTLRSLGLGCPGRPVPVEAGAGDVRLAELRAWQVGGDVLVHAAPVAPAEGEVERLVVLSPPEDPLTRSGVHDAVQPVLGPTTQVERLASLEMTPANARLSEWGVLLGTWGMALLAVAGLIGAGGNFVEAARSTAPLSALTGRRRWYLGVASGFLAAPMAVSAVLAALLSLPLGTVVQQNRQVPVAPPDTLASIALGAVVLALVFGAAAGLLSARVAASWRPGRE
ncbi:hypothetical protein [Nocardiopsis potens]|uniref:hypothetical protein n=1 Tax=Nocardiopsis potens TaxID=1246458 RepID=UPI0003452700|nr:hypothetical protein [Nocardiopsis potens]